MNNKLKGYIALSRIISTFPNTLVITLVAIAITDGYFGLRAITIFLANWLFLISIYAINDVEDADDDAQEPSKAKRNPISNGSLTKSEGYLYTLATGVISLLLYGLISFYVGNIQISILASFGLIIGYLYSWKAVRLKSIPFLDILSHGFMLSVAQFLVTYFTFTNNLTEIGITFSIALFLISIHGDLENENRDFDVDRKTKIKNTVQLIGNLRVSRILQYTFLVFTSIFLIYSLACMRIKIDYYIWLSIIAGILISVAVYFKKIKKISKSYQEIVELVLQYVAFGILIVYILLKGG